MLNTNLENKSIWLTGASRGIGKSIAEKLAETEANLILSASNSDSFKDLIHRLSNKKNTMFFPFDLSNYDEIKKTYSKIEAIYGKVDILINNAGIGVFKILTDISNDDIERTLGINFKGSFFCIQSVLPEMIKSKSGMIINISSVAAINNFPEGTIYGASKSALTSMSSSLREEIRQFGIKVIDILPGATQTDIWDQESLQQFAHRMMKPEDIADLVLSVIHLNLNPRLMTELIVIKPQLGNI